ncbi:hypothetical protein [Amycolatopsis antarctica]|nr:hypothetical protein [Amycolatopsis antarctica]
MTVQELITILEKHDPQTLVQVYTEKTCGGSPATGVTVWEDGVCIDG